MERRSIHLIRVDPDFDSRSICHQVQEKATSSPLLLFKGTVHGWAHRPHQLDRDLLLSEEWDVFLLLALPYFPVNVDGIKKRATFPVSIPKEQLQSLIDDLSQAPTPCAGTTPLPNNWAKPGNESAIPDDAMVPAEHRPLGVGELRLDPSMAEFLTQALPRAIRFLPVCFFNLFKYKNDDRTVHDSYMEGFRQNFGDAAGATIKFMGPSEERTADAGKWDDANLVQYDSVWHYAYMLSTNVYKELNVQKVSGLKDTCILLVSGADEW